jgi:hypothetical protein
MQKLPLLAPIKGLRYNRGGTLIDDAEMTNCLNVYIDRQGCVKKKEGYVLKGSNLPLHGIPMLIDQFFLSNSISYLLAATTTDFYKYDSGTNLWRFITPNYFVGTVTVTNGSPIITGLGTVWLTNIKVGDAVGIGNTDMDLITNWYYVLTVDSNTQITLTALYTQIDAAGQPYVIRKLQTGTASDPVNAETMNDLFIFTNGIDVMKKWDGSLMVQDLGGNPPICKYLKKYKSYLVLGNTLETGTAYPQRARWCDTGLPESWIPGVGSNAGHLDLNDGVDWIVGWEVINDYLVCFKERSIYNGYLIGTSQIFQFDMKVNGTGCASGETIGVVGDEIFFLGWDSVYAYNGINIVDIADQVKDNFVGQLNPNKLGLSFAMVWEEMDEYVLFCCSSGATYNDTLWIYNSAKKGWTKGTAGNITQGGYYSKEHSFSWLTFGGIWSDAMVRWNDRTLLAASPTNIFGDSGNNIYEMDYTDNDENGVAVTSFFDTKDFTMQLWDIEKHWLRLDIWGEGSPVNLYYSTDEGNSWTLIGIVPLTGAMSRHKMDFRFSSEKVRFRLENNNSNEPFRIRMLDLYWEEGGRVSG